MKQVPNQYIALLVIIALIISGISTFVVMLKFAPITGRGTSVSEAAAHFEITAVTAINWTNSSLDWGAGSVNAGATSAALDSNDTNCTSPVPDGSWERECDDLTLENTGTELVNITISCDNDAVSLMGGSNPGFEWFFWEEGNACFGDLNATAWTPILQGVNETICTGFNYTSSDDALSMDVNITVPNDATNTGPRTAIFIATATTIVP